MQFSHKHFPKGRNIRLATEEVKKAKNIRTKLAGGANILNI